MSDEFRTGIQYIREFGNEYIKKELFTPKKQKFSYSKDKLPVGFDANTKELVCLDIKDGTRTLLCGAAGCLDENTLIKCSRGNKQIKNINSGHKVLSYNFETKKQEYKKIIKYPAQDKECFEIELENGEKIIASADHKFFLADGKVVQLKDLKDGDDLFEYKQTKCKWCNKDILDYKKYCGLSCCIKSIKSVGVRRTYDIEVQDNHNFFLSNGILTHNSGKTFVLRGLMDRVAQIGFISLFAVDVKDEMKCLDINQYVLTTKGRKKVGKLKPNKDKVLGYDYNTKQIIPCDFQKTKIIEKECYEIEFEDGRKITCSNEHKFFGYAGKEVKLKDLNVGDKLFGVQKCLECNKIFHSKIEQLVFAKIKSIKCVGKRKVIDICVPQTNNFILDNKILTHNSSVRPVQFKFQHLLIKGEKPTGMEVLTLRPSFFSSLRVPYNKLSKDNEWFSVRLNDMTKGDFMMLLDYHNLTPTQRILLEEIWDGIQKLPVFNSLDQVYDIIDLMDDLKETQVVAIKRKFKPILFSKFFVDEYCFDILPAMKQSVLFSFNMENFDAFGRDAASLPQVFMTIMLRKIIHARRLDLIPGIFIVVDELSRFVPENQETITTIELKESFDVDRRFFINYIIATQEIKKVPPAMLNQCRYIFVPYNAPLDTFLHAITNTGISRNQQYAKNQAGYIKKVMKKHQWMMIDRDEMKYTIIDALAPLSEHCEVKRN